MEGAAERPTVGVSLLVVKEIDGAAHVLLTRRLDSLSYGTPGGHVEGGENFEATALRELEEECGKGLRVTFPRFLCVSNLDGGHPHRIGIGMVSHWVSGEPVQMEPEKAGMWMWHRLDEPPKCLFGVVGDVIEAYDTGRPYFG